MLATEQYVRELGRQLADWRTKVGTVQLKARFQGKDSAWLEHALARQDELQALVDEVRTKDEAQLQNLQARIAIVAQEFEIALVRAAERFQESHELGFDPSARKGRAPRPASTGARRGSQSA